MFDRTAKNKVRQIFKTKLLVNTCVYWFRFDNRVNKYKRLSVYPFVHSHGIVGS